MNLRLHRPSLMLRSVGLLLPGVLVSWLAAAQVVITATDAAGLPVPDNSTVGIARDLMISGVPGIIDSVEVKLSLSPMELALMYNGDIYVTLSHNSQMAVLLNRVGRREGAPAGYGDSGFAVTLSDAAPADIHNYRITLKGSHLLPLSPTATPAALTGSWQPDGRRVDPEVVTSASPRSAGLSVFNGGDPNGTWTLFVADFSPGGQARLDDWSLSITPVPEPLETGLAITSLMLVWAGWRKRRSLPPQLAPPK